MGLEKNKLYRVGNSANEPNSILTTIRLNLLAVAVGIIGGYGAVLFRWLIYVINNISFHRKFSINFISPLHHHLGFLVVIPPIIGGFIVGLITYYFAPETKGHGVPEVMEAVFKRGGIIRPRVVIAKILASGVCLGTGGSAGREGPIVQIGSAFGSSLSQFLKLTAYERKVLIGCGATAGIAATFNAPIAGVIFSVELILLELKAKSFVPLVVSSVFATIISRMYFGSNASFLVPHYHFVSLYELIFYLIMGILAGFLGILESKMLYKFEDAFEALKVHPVLKPVIGGALLGLVGIIFPQVFGVGYETIGDLLNVNYGSPHLYLIIFLVSLLFAKMVALSITLGSGGSGGVFAPSLFIGAVLGSAFGVLINLLFPYISAPYPAYSLVGMASVFSSASRATLTSIIMVFEMTRDYKIIVPLIFSCVIANIVSLLFYKETIYTEKLTRRGIKIPNGLKADLMECEYVKDIMTKNVIVVREHETVEEVKIKIFETGHHGFPILDSYENLIGIVTGRDVLTCQNEKMTVCNIDKVCERELIVTYPDETFEQAWEKMSRYNISHLPVVERNNPSKLVGIVTKTDLILHKPDID